MADNDPVVFDERGAKLLDAARKVVANQNRNPQGRPADAFRISSGKWLSFINQASEEVPPYACMRVTGSTYDDEGNIIALYCDKPSTDFVTEYVFNGSMAVPALSEGTTQAAGLCTAGPWAVVACDTALTITSTHKLGPKPGSWLLFRGWPAAARVAGVQDATERWAFARVGPITTVVAKTSSAIAALSTANVAGTGTATIWTNTGSTFAESSPKQTFTGTNFSTVASTTTDLYGFTERDGVMCMDAPASAGGAVGLWQATLTADLLSSASSASVGSAVLMSDGSSASITSASNPLAYCGTSGKSVILAGRTGSYSIIGIGVTATTLILDVVTSSSAIEKVKRQAAVMFNESASTTATVIQLTTLCST